MKTLIELYDERPIENVLATEVFHPERTIFLCEPMVAQDKRTKKMLTDYFTHCGLRTEILIYECSLYNSEKIAAQLNKILETYPESAIDITGGTDAALFACGEVCANRDVHVFTYSRKKNAFFPIHNSSLKDGKPCLIDHTVDDCFRMTGGRLLNGRVDNKVLKKYMRDFEPFFAMYLQHRSDWIKTVNYMQRASQDYDADEPLLVDSPLQVKGANGKRVQASVPVLRALQDIDFISNLKITDSHARFTFRDAQIRQWLRDVGSVLELYIYKLCAESNYFTDVVTSAVVDWEGSTDQSNVKNEIDVMCTKGITPLFISCKTCAVATEALNELAILRDRFGGNGAKAIIVSSQKCGAAARRRAAELGIDVIDLDVLRSGSTSEQILAVMKNRS